MRTREEQAASLSDSLCADYVSPKVHEAGYELALRHIEEAERRAEQRVRAEIGRDSERLEWLEKSIPEYGIGRSYAKFYIDKGCIYVSEGDTIRQAIDAAREVG